MHAASDEMALRNPLIQGYTEKAMRGSVLAFNRPDAEVNPTSALNTLVETSRDGASCQPTRSSDASDALSA